MRFDVQPMREENLFLSLRKEECAGRVKSETVAEEKDT